ncbi:DUF1631 family protein [Gilvimarinus algae]|uniref:DUF1631 family protein n=1 Tax=Gilvimarinus algae TaxID=3058037 RepID=A0ABT8TLH9_9GAMM|nr:DUF1631 family protein [Gilvimarinus sp. SDUM040014]MDO3383217.1 DUF1631 family protein [Gilvimarinus sp. SDUM040014]
MKPESDTARPEDRLVRIRELLGLPREITPASVAQLQSLSPQLLQAQNPWVDYAVADFSRAAGLPGLYGYWLWQALGENLQCAPELADAVDALCQRLVEAVCADPDIALVEIKQQRRAWDQLFFHLHTWCAALGPQARKFTERLDALVSALAAPPAEWQEPLEALNQACDRELDRAALLAERMQVSELGRIKAAHAESRVAELYNQTVAGRGLPEAVLMFINEAILPALQYVLINESEQAPDWNFWNRMLRLLVWSFNPEKTAEEKQSFYNKGPALLSQLEQAEPPHSCSAAHYQGFLAELSAMIIALLKGQTVETAPAPTRDVNKEARLLSQLQSSGPEHHFTTGDWIEFSGDDTLRCQFLLQVPGTDQLLFINRAGHKVLQKSAAQMRVCLEAGIAREIPQVPVFSAALTAANARLAHLQQICEAQAASEREARAEAERQRQEVQRLKSLELAARREAEAKARAEAERLAAQREVREREERKRREAEVLAQREQDARESLDNLTLGTWADLPLAEGKTIRCKLAVSMRSTGKYIFVDRVGSKVAELQYDQLLAMLLADEAVFYQPEQRFENRLESIVRGLRRTE